MNPPGGTEQMRERLELLVRAGEMFHQSLNLRETLYNVARVAVESFADLCLFDLLDERSGRLYVTAGTHRDVSFEGDLKSMGSSILYDSEFRVHPAVRVARTGVPFFVPVMDQEQITAHAVSPAHADFMRRMDYRSKIVVPVVLQSSIYGALTFVRTADNESFTARDVQFAQELGRRAGLAVANAKQYHREQHAAATLQDAFLVQQLPDRPGVSFNALYRPSGDAAKLGGDWYDAFHTVDGSTVITIGDISGKGIDAARLMVQVRQSVRVAATITRDPAEMLRIVNDVLFLDGSEALATTFIGVLDPEVAHLTYASAGHPPAFLRRRDGRIEALSTGSLPIGIGKETLFRSDVARIEADALLLLYTDGLSEITRDPVAGEAMILQLLKAEAVLHAGNPARYFERLLGSKQPSDDIAIMTVRFARPGDREWRFDAGDPTVAYGIQRELIQRATSSGSHSKEDVDTCHLIVSELIGNVVRHAPGALSVSISFDAEGVWLHMIDEGPGFEFRSTLPKNLWSESGRGLFLIAALARSITVEPLPGSGSYIRVCLPLQAPNPSIRGVLAEAHRSVPRPSIVDSH
jgi:serine phosphatase RsbU (regulator of sigma subunit)/anti-sigma regulatory factor (Ser/Thr protein kinase)